MRVIKNIVFDIGNVLLNFKPKEFLAERFTEEEASFLFSAIFDTEEWIELDRGTLSEEEALEIFLRRNPEREGILRRVMKDFYTLFTPIQVTTALLRPLRDKGFNLYFLSNIHTGIFSHIVEIYPFFNEFEGGIVSAKEKLLKPDPAIYHCLTERYRLEPEESLFIDDTRRNITAAEKLGFQTIHLTNPDNLESELEMRLSKPVE